MFVLLGGVWLIGTLSSVVVAFFRFSTFRVLNLGLHTSNLPLNPRLFFTDDKEKFKLYCV